MLKIHKFILKKNFSFFKENSYFFFKGPLGKSLLVPYNKKINIEIIDNFIVLKSTNLSFFNLYKKLIFQKIKGVLYGFKIKLKLNGVGFVAEQDQQNLILKLGFSSKIFIKIPETIKVKVKKRKILKILGCDLNEITQFASKIRSYKIPEIYKGKGILYFKEKVKLKIGKKN